MILLYSMRAYRLRNMLYCCYIIHGCIGKQCHKTSGGGERASVWRAFISVLWVNRRDFLKSEPISSGLPVTYTHGAVFGVIDSFSRDFIYARATPYKNIYSYTYGEREGKLREFIPFVPAPVFSRLRGRTCFFVFFFLFYRDKRPQPPATVIATVRFRPVPRDIRRNNDVLL